jgi:hypothetical protein
MARAWSWRIAAAMLSAVILWRVIHVNAVLYEDTGHPRLPSAPSADLGQGRDDLEMLRAQLRENPAHVAALLLVAQVLSSTDSVAAARAYAAAYQLAPLDREVLHEAAAFFLAQGKAAEALVLLARLVEHYPAEREGVFPVIADMLAARPAVALEAVTVRDPEWAGAFIVSSCRRGVDPAVLLPLFMKRIASASAKPAEGACLVDRLRGAGRWEEAYHVWLDTLPPDRLGDIGFIYNGSFEFAPSGAGFDWMPTRQLEREAGHSVEIARTTGGTGRRSLKVSFNGKRQAGIPIAQYLALAPGRYVASGMGRSDGMRAGRGVHWTVRCVTDAVAGPAIATSERFTGSSEWRAFEFPLTVPPSCRGQLLQLEPVGIEDGPAYVTGAAWFDDLAMREAR